MYSIRYSNDLYGSWPYNIVTERFDTLEEAKAFKKKHNLKSHILVLKEGGKSKKWVKAQ